MEGKHHASQPSSNQLWANVGLGNKGWRLQVPFPLLQHPVLSLLFWLWGILYPLSANPALAHLPEDLLGLHRQPGFHQGRGGQRRLHPLLGKRGKGRASLEH